MTLKSIAFWSSTGLFSAAMAAGGVADLTGGMADAMTQLGYPLYFATILGVWKLLGVVALMAPIGDRIKEWAYAGFFFNLTGAVASHLSNGDPSGTLVAPVVLLALAAVSYVLEDRGRSVDIEVRPRGEVSGIATY